MSEEKREYSVSERKNWLRWLNWMRNRYLQSRALLEVYRNEETVILLFISERKDFFYWEFIRRDGTDGLCIPCDKKMKNEIKNIVRFDKRNKMYHPINFKWRNYVIPFEYEQAEVFRTNFGEIVRKEIEEFESKEIYTKKDIVDNEITGGCVNDNKTC